MRQFRFYKNWILVVGLGFLAFTNCTSKTTPFEYFNQMYDSPAREAQEEDHFSKDNSSSRIPPLGAIPVGYFPYPYIDVATPDELPAPLKGLANPLTSPDLDDYKKGEQKYQTYCSPCHGVQGLGNGKVVGPYPRFSNVPPPVISSKIKEWTDGQLYHIITMGRGLMGSYAYQIEPDDRWKLVAYIRKLQDYDTRTKK